MSAGSSMSSVDLLPPPHGHGHGHNRGRGHSRSRQWAQFSVPSTEQQPSTASTVSTYPNGYGLDSALNGHLRPRPRSPLPGDTRGSTLESEENSDLKASQTVLESSLQSGTSLNNTDNRSLRNYEVVAGLLMALPWLAISSFAKQYALQDPIDAASDDSNSATAIIPGSGLERIGQKTCILTSVTLILTGCWQALRLGLQDGSSKGTFKIKPPQFSAKTAGASFLQICSVGFPIYASLKIGGFLVAFAISLAIASGVPTISAVNSFGSFRAQLSQKRLTVALLATVVVLSFLGFNTSWDHESLTGYVALVVSVFAIRPPFSDAQGSLESVLGLSSNLGSNDSPSQQKLSNSNFPSIASPDNAGLAIFSGGFIALITTIFSISRGDFSFGILDLLYALSVAGAFTLSLVYSSPSSLRAPQKFGLAVGTGAAVFCAVPVGDSVFGTYMTRSVVAAASFLTARLDDRQLGHTHDHHHSHSYYSSESSKITKLILSYSEPYPLLHSILREKDSRRIFYFMGLNFAFMLVQLSYGFLTGSLGLLSDSIHMFFDCLALVVGLCAAVMSKWPPSARFPYGYGKVDTLSGFANGIFLMIISVEIIYEAVERLSSGSQMHRIGELLVVSLAGLAVNLVGIMSFEHGHAHGHGHDHGHSHDHSNENMHGIFLHILADTLGSVAVVISTILVHFYGWPGFDPLASCLIAILIFASAVPLVSGTAKKLLLTLPADVEYNLRDTLAGVSTLRGVSGYTVPKFWLDDTSSVNDGHGHGHGHGHCNGHDAHHHHEHSHSHSHSNGDSHDHTHPHTHNNSHDHTHSHSSHSHSHSHDHSHDHGKQPPVLGVIHIIASRGSDLEDVRQRTIDFLREKNMDILVQVEREGDGRCWCGGGSKSS